MSVFKTKLYSRNGSLRADVRETFCSKGKRYGFTNPYCYIMPDIVDVKVIEEKAIIVSFADGTNEKATLDKEDKFNLEQGISICITKKLLEEKCRNGSNLYNKIVKRAEKVYTQKIETLKKLKSEEEEKERIIAKKRKKNEQRRIKREMAAKEKQIEIQKEAYLRAMYEYNKSN